MEHLLYYLQSRVGHWIKAGVQVTDRYGKKKGKEKKKEKKEKKIIQND